MLLYRNKKPTTQRRLSSSYQAGGIKGSGWWWEAGGGQRDRESCLLLDWTRSDCSFCLPETLRMSLFEYQRGKHGMREIDLGPS